jgi:hypothetical protein
MSENLNEEKKYIVEDLFSSALTRAIYKEIMNSRKCTGDDQFSYQPIEKDFEGKKYIIYARHIPVGEAMSYAKSSCNKCYGSGKKIMNIEKDRIPNTDDFMMLSSVSLKGLTEEQQKIVIEREKATKFWKILLPCPCTIKGLIKKGVQVLSNDLNNILIEITCTEKSPE